MSISAVSRRAAADAATCKPGGGNRPRGPDGAVLRRLPGVDGQQAGLAQRRLLEREREGSVAVVQVTDADADQPVHGRGLAADHDYRAGRVISRVPGDRPQHHRRERADAAEADDQHQRVRPAFRDRPRGLPLDRIGADQQARGHLGGPGRRSRQDAVTVVADEAEGGLALWLELEHDHLGQRRGRHDPQRDAAQRGFPGGPLHRTLGFPGTVRSGHDGLGAHRWSSSPDSGTPGCPRGLPCCRHRDLAPARAIGRFGRMSGTKVPPIRHCPGRPELASRLRVIRGDEVRTALITGPFGPGPSGRPRCRLGG